MSEIIDKTAEQIQSWIENDTACLIDVREDHEFDDIRIPNTQVHIPLSRFDPDKIPKNSSQKLVFICAQGTRSMQVGQYLLDNEVIDEAYNLKDGIIGWKRAGQPVEYE